MFTSTKIKTAIAITLFSLLLASFVCGYSLAAKKYHVLIGQVRQQESQLKADYKKAQLKVVKKQKKLNEIAKQQREKDDQAQVQIEKLTTELANQRVRVRVQPEASKCSGTGTGSGRNTRAGKENTDKTHRLLPELNSKRLASAIKEIETLSSAYTSCKKSLEINNQQ